MKKSSICVCFFIGLFLMSSCLAMAAGEMSSAIEAKEVNEKIFIVNTYRYEPGESEVDTDAGQAICGSRCNALSADYQNYLEPPGWRIIKVASGKELLVDLNNPFLKGECTCVADEYEVKVNELYMIK